MNEFNGFDDIDWSKYESAYGDASILPEMIKKLLTSDKDVFSDTMRGVYATFCHQGTIYGGTVKSVPLFWKVLQYHIDNKHYEFAKKILDYLQDIYKPDEWYIEPFGKDLNYILKNYPEKYERSFFFEMEEEMFKFWDIILEYFHSDLDWLRNQALFFIRYNLPKAEESIILLRETIPHERNEGILVNLLSALALLEADLGIDSDIDLFINFLHPEYPLDIRIVGLLGYYILKRGDVTDSIAKIIIHYVKNIDDNYSGAREQFNLKAELILNEFKINNPNYDMKEIYKESNIELYFRYHFSEAFESKMSLFFVRPGANELLIPVLCDIFDKIPERMEKSEIASVNIAETLLSFLFPIGLTEVLKTTESLNEYQRAFISKLLDSRKWEFKIFSMLLNEYEFGSTKEELKQFLSDYPHFQDFNDALILQKLKSQFDFNFTAFYKIDKNERIIELDLSYFEEEIIEEVIGDLKNLKKIKFSPSNSKLYKGLAGKLPSLEVLEVDIYKLEYIPDFIENLPSLTTLSIKSTDREDFPQWLQNLKKLKKLILELDFNRKVPEFIRSLSSLTSLDIRISMITFEKEIPQIEILPDIFDSLNELKYLNLANIYGLKELPHSLCKLKRLRELKLGIAMNTDGGLDALPECLGELENLEKLVIDHINIKTFPDSIGKLKKLTSLECSSRALESLPESIGMLKSLKNLTIRGGNICNLPETIGELEALKTLSITSAKLTSLPRSISKLENLREIYINNNQISELPSKLPNLINFSFHVNPVEEDSKKVSDFLQIIVDQKTSEVELYFKSNPDKWKDIYKDFENLIRRISFSLVGFAAFAQFYMLKGAELNNISMIRDSLGRFAVSLEHYVPQSFSYRQKSYAHLKDAFQQGTLFEPARNFLLKNEIPAEDYLNELKENLMITSKSPDEENDILENLNEHAWFYLTEELNLEFSLACGQYMNHYGSKKQIPMWECYGKDVIASTLVIKGDLESLKQAVILFEEIKEIDEEWYSSHMFDLAISKLKELE